jgi:uncharacterized membrane protein HdeD (DUF308 family)
MKPILIVGLVLIALGVAALASRGITYTSRDVVLDIGPVRATADRQKTLSLPPVVGTVVVLGGVALLVVGLRRRT